MQPRIDLITLGVRDLERALTFYREGLGLQSRGIVGTEFPGDEKNAAGATVMFQLQPGLILSLYPLTELAKDGNVTAPSQSGAFSLGQLVSSRAEVDNMLARAKAAGATITDSPHERPWGIYSGYFRDLDGHLWEIIWNPSS